MPSEWTSFVVIPALLLWRGQGHGEGENGWWQPVFIQSWWQHLYHRQLIKRWDCVPNIMWTRIRVENWMLMMASDGGNPIFRVCGDGCWCVAVLVAGMQVVSWQAQLFCVMIVTWRDQFQILNWLFLRLGVEFYLFPAEISPIHWFSSSDHSQTLNPWLPSSRGCKQPNKPGRCKTGLGVCLSPISIRRMKMSIWVK